MKLVLAIMIICIVFFNSVSAKESPACQQIDFSSTDISATELRRIAVTCKDTNMARLYYNRAYHKDLLSEGEALSSITQYNTESNNYQLAAYRLYIAMLEELVPLYYPEVQQRVAFLNMVYERRSEVVELRLHGYDKLADVLERKMLF